MNQIKSNRIESLDLLKGFIMVIMALDHVRSYIHFDAFFFSPTDPENTNTALFFTRWITHYCAPVFSLLAGISAYLIGRRKTKSELSLFLLKRGIWLIFVDLVIVNFAWYFDTHFGTISLLVFWFLGISMIFLAVLIHLPLMYVLIISVIVILGHNALDYLTIEKSIFWSILHEFSFFPFESGKLLFVGYPIVPWIGVMSLGYYFGSFYESNIAPVRRQKLFKVIGALTILAFLVIRLINGYGNLNYWKSFDTVLQSAFSFLAPAKYPPSLTYLLMTLGPALLILAYTENVKGKVVGFFSVFGKVPFFFYVIHLYIIHALALLLAWGTGFGWQKMIITSGWVTSTPELKGYGLSLWYVYLIWISVIILLYPICKKFSSYKLNHKEKKWLSYL
ncbi:MAG: heparan-alpha-glucosaminide N-acetyltransferase domain-containing protein [Cyclobacteriaceae bacterium]